MLLQLIREIQYFILKKYQIYYNCARLANFDNANFIFETLQVSVLDNQIAKTSFYMNSHKFKLFLTMRFSYPKKCK